MIFLSIFICFYLFFFRRQRRNFLYLTHVKTSSCGTIERIERMFFFLGFAQSFNNQVNLLGGEYS